MTFGRLAHRSNVLWIAALVHRLSGIALAIFLPLHFLTLGLAIDGEGGLVFLLLVHMLGGVRLLVLENLDWRDEQKELATIAAALSAVAAFIFLARVL